MTILVTGSAGHLGEGLMRTLRAGGLPARGLDLWPSPFTTDVGSISDRGLLKEVMAGVTAVIHAATLHKPHVATHSQQAFVDINVTGTLALLEAAREAGAKAFVYTSTTSAFGSALTPGPGAPAAWITEDVQPVPRNIYGVTKVAAESLCELFHRRDGLPVVILRTSRFFPEPDDNAAVREAYETANAQANEMLYRRVDLEDVVSAHLLGVAYAGDVGFDRFIISATTPFEWTELPELRADAAAVVERIFPGCGELYAARGWKLFPSLDRVYVNERARAELGWRPKYDFQHVLDSLAAGHDFRSPLAIAVGSKGYHAETFEEGPYPVA
ncbi:MAG TPA: NAD(P)-dependent oxidoreductase [Caulobacteraceae bacterium]|nr:NAD(P)-dependent oxidoreductase [Caulobacteraceae bacterium]